MTSPRSSTTMTSWRGSGRSATPTTLVGRELNGIPSGSTTLHVSARVMRATSRRSTGGRRRAPSSTRISRRSTGCSARTPSCPGSWSGSCLSRLAAPRARLSSTTICARCGRCLRRRRGRSSERAIGPGRSASSTSGSREKRCRSVTARPARGGSSLRALATRAPAPGCSCSQRRLRICSPESRATSSDSARFRSSSFGIGRPASTATKVDRLRRSPRSAGS